MRIAKDPFDEVSITPIHYQERHGKPVSASGAVNNRPAAKCPACDGDLHLKGELDPAVETIFSHNPTKAFCPIKESARHNYEILEKKDEDPERSAALKAAFFSSWKRHWNQFRRYVGHADIKDFIALVKYADRKGIWRYRSLREHEILAIILVIKDFQPVEASDGRVLRKHWVRFWFESSVKTLDDFWNLPEARRRLIKASYDLPKRAHTLNSKYLVAFDVVSIVSEFLEVPESQVPPVHVYVEGCMLQAFPGNWLSKEG
jgi:hypothetical protein